MTPERLQEFKKLLLERRESLLIEAGKTVNGMNDSTGQYPDPTDRALHESHETFTLRIRDRERKLIMKIDEALERINNGTFGICNLCGEEIPESRLIARPVTTLCIDCKKSQEEQEKKIGI